MHLIYLTKLLLVGGEHFSLLVFSDRSSFLNSFVDVEEGGGQHDSASLGCLDQMLKCTRAPKFNKLNDKDLLLIRKKVFFCTEKINVRIDIYELFNDEDVY